MKKSILTYVFAFFLFSGINVLCQQEEQIKETDSRVPELEKFHEIIYPIWHTAYPEKDYAALKSYVQEVNELADSIYNAKLPGILRDKKEKWDKGVSEFRSSVEEYEKQAKGNDNDALLKAAEKLHADYEMLIRIIRPVLKEVDQFHQLLYVIYHTYLPGKEYKKIISVSGELAEKAEAITKANLPKKFESKKEKIDTAAKELLTAVQQLGRLKDDSEGKAIEASVENLHAKYQSLEEIF